MNYIKYILSAIVVIIAISSCSEDFLDRQPLDQINSSNFYKTEEDANIELICF